MNVLRAACLLFVIMTGVVPPASAEGADDPFVILAGLPRDHLLEITLDDGSERKFINDGDTVILRGWGEKGGVRLAKSVEEAETLVKQMLGRTLVTHQTGPVGKQVGRVYIEDGYWDHSDAAVVFQLSASSFQPPAQGPV